MIIRQDTTYQTLSIAVAFVLGLLGVCVGVVAHKRADVAETVLQRVVERLDKTVLPVVQTTLDTMHDENRIVIDNLGLIRHRVELCESKIERKIHHKRPIPGISFISMMPPTARELIDKELDKLIMKGETKLKRLPSVTEAL